MRNFYILIKRHTITAKHIIELKFIVNAQHSERFLLDRFKCEDYYLFFNVLHKY